MVLSKRANRARLQRQTQALQPVTKPSAGTHWQFRCALDKGLDVIDAWYQRLQVKARARFRRALDQLKQRELKDWSRPLASPLGDHIYVIRFKDQTGAQLRVFGHAIPEKCVFVMSQTAEEKDDVYNPDNCVEQATKFRNGMVDDLNRDSRLCFNGNA